MFLCQKLERTSTHAPHAYANTVVSRSPALDALPSEDELLACMTSLGKPESWRNCDTSDRSHNHLGSYEYSCASEGLINKEICFWKGPGTAEPLPRDWENVGQHQEYLGGAAQSTNGYYMQCTEGSLDPGSFDQGCRWTRWQGTGRHVDPKNLLDRGGDCAPDLRERVPYWGSEDFKASSAGAFTTAITSGGAEIYNNRNMNHPYTPRSTSHSALTDTAVENMMNTLNLKNVTDPILLFQSLMGFKEQHCKDLMAAICESGTSFGTIVGAYLHNIGVMSADSLAPSGKLAGTLAKAVATRYRDVFTQSGSSTNTTTTSTKDTPPTMNAWANHNASRTVKFGSIGTNRNGGSRMGKVRFSEFALRKAPIGWQKGAPAPARFSRKGQIPLPRLWQRKNNNRGNGADVCSENGTSSNPVSHPLHRLPRSDREPRPINTNGFHPKSISAPHYHRQVVW